MDFYKEGYSNYVRLQEEFNKADNNQERKRILKELFGSNNKLLIIAKFVKKFIENHSKAIVVEPLFIINNDNAIQYRLINNITNHDSTIVAPVYSFINDTKTTNRIKSLEAGTFVSCCICLQTASNQEKHGRLFTFLPETLNECNIVDIKKFEEKEKLLLTHCSLYKLFDGKEKSNDLKDWNYENFLNLVGEDILNSLLDKAKNDEKILELNEEVDKKKKERNDLVGEINAKIEESKKLSEQIDALNKRTDKYSQLLKPFSINLNLAEFEEIIQEKTNDIKRSFRIIDYSTIKDIQTALEKCKKGVILKYSASVIRQIYAGIQTNQLIVLIGDPGSGKTSMAMHFADCMNNESKTKIIPVQPGWMDKTDLLGYYNPLEKCYVPTEFLDTLIDFSKLASENHDNYYIICLDEMNLSQVEYYFADFLSKLQTDRKITLYSHTIYEEMKRDFLLTATRFVSRHKDRFEEIAGKDLEEYIRLEHTKKTLSRYKNEIVIPDNVKFIGTLNQDETTKDLSPKVLDRSLVIKLQSNIQKEIMMRESNISENSATNSVGWSEEVKTEWDSLVSEFAKHNIRVSKRLETAAKVLAEVLTDKEMFFDVVVSTMILPKINCSPYQNDIEDIKAILKSFCEKETRLSSKFIYEDMIKRCENDQDMLTFWSK